MNSQAETGGEESPVVLLAVSSALRQDESPHVTNGQQGQAVVDILYCLSSQQW